jgi:ankyrin repeat protein
LHDLKADISASDKKGCTPLHAAAMTGQIEAVVLLAELLPKHALDAYDHDGMRAIHVASRDDRGAVIAALVRAGADLKVQDRNGRSAAHWAAAEGCAKALRQLAAAKAPLAMPDNAGHSPAYLAGGGQHKECLAVLAESAPRHVGATAGFTAQAVRPKAYVPDELPTFDPRIYARNLARVKTRP